MAVVDLDSPLNNMKTELSWESWFTQQFFFLFRQIYAYLGVAGLILFNFVWKRVLADLAQTSDLTF